MRLEAKVIAPDVLVPEALDPGALVNWLPRRSKPLDQEGLEENPAALP